MGLHRRAAKSVSHWGFCEFCELCELCAGFVRAVGCCVEHVEQFSGRMVRFGKESVSGGRRLGARVCRRPAAAGEWSGRGLRFGCSTLRSSCCGWVRRTQPRSPRFHAACSPGEGHLEPPGFYEALIFADQYKHK